MRGYGGSIVGTRLMPINMLWSSDFFTDPDDVLAAVLLAYAYVRAYRNPIAVGISVSNPNSAPALDGLLKTYGLVNVPIGVPGTSTIVPGAGPYQATMKARTAAIVDPMRVYDINLTMFRRALANTQRATELVSVGLLTSYSELLDSPADSISPLTGRQLIEQRTQKLFIMGGQYPNGSEYNFNVTAAARLAAANVSANWPVEIVNSGFEVGNTVITGGNLQGQQATNLIAQALLDSGVPAGRNSWDPMCALLSLVAFVTQGGYTQVRGANSVDIGTGANIFTPNIAGKDSYVVKALADVVYQTRINNLLLPANWPITTPVLP